jgi:hypothetical protein
MYTNMNMGTLLAHFWSFFLILERLSKTSSKVANFDALVAGGAHFVIRGFWMSKCHPPVDMSPQTCWYQFDHCQWAKSLTSPEIMWKTCVFRGALGPNAVSTYKNEPDSSFIRNSGAKNMAWGPFWLIKMSQRGLGHIFGYFFRKDVCAYVC